jgi:uncharacterized protein
VTTAPPRSSYTPLSVDEAASTATPAPQQLPAPRRGVAVAGMATTAMLLWVTARGEGVPQALLLTLGLGLGVTLYHARFGFTSAFRQLVSVGQGRALQAHALMIAAAAVLFAPLLSAGVGLFGQETAGYVAPVGLGVLLGAFLFGVGMQLGGACASGTLFATGAGHVAVLLTLGGFVVGSVIGAWHFGFWTEGAGAAWSLGAVSLADSRLGYGGALAITLTALVAIMVVAEVVIRRRRPPELGRPASASGLARVLRGSWPLWVGALALAGLNAAVLAVSGSPWGVTGAFALWGSKALAALGVADPSTWAFWQGDPDALQASVLADDTSVTNLGIMLGALVAAAIGGTFRLHRRVPARTVAAALLGGVLMGYGARLAYGCNIGAYFGGIASFSLHGWLWGVMAIAGTFAGLRARPLFALANPRPSDPVC